MVGELEVIDSSTEGSADPGDDSDMHSIFSIASCYDNLSVHSFGSCESNCSNIIDTNLNDSCSEQNPVPENSDVNLSAVGSHEHTCINVAEPVDASSSNIAATTRKPWEPSSGSSSAFTNTHMGALATLTSDYLKKFGKNAQHVLTSKYVKKHLDESL